MKKSWLNVLSIAALAGVMTLASCGVTPSSSSSNSEPPQSSEASESTASSAQEEREPSDSIPDAGAGHSDSAPHHKVQVHSYGHRVHGAGGHPGCGRVLGQEIPG